MKVIRWTVDRSRSSMGCAVDGSQASFRKRGTVFSHRFSLSLRNDVSEIMVGWVACWLPCTQESAKPLSCAVGTVKVGFVERNCCRRRSTVSSDSFLFLRIPNRQITASTCLESSGSNLITPSVSPRWYKVQPAASRSFLALFQSLTDVFS